MSDQKQEWRLTQLEARMARIERAFIVLGSSAVGIVVLAVVQTAGLLP